ncbi:hypothetical protein V866_000676 [Kwoniella sp. B9012]
MTSDPTANFNLQANAHEFTLSIGNAVEQDGQFIGEYCSQPVSQNNPVVSPLHNTPPQPTSCENPSRLSGWPRFVSADRFLSRAFPYDTLYQNELGSLRALSASSGLSALHYLREQRGTAMNIVDSFEFPINLPDISLSPNLLPLLPNLSIAGNERPSVTATATHPSTSGRSMSDQSERYRSNVWQTIEEEAGSTLKAKTWALVEHFLESTYILWPTFNISSFTAQAAAEHSRSNPDFVCLIMAICALTLRETGASSSLEAEVGLKYHELYWSIRHANQDCNWSSTSSIQGLFYLSMYCFGGSGSRGVAMGHTLMGEAVSRCFDEGLHRRFDAYQDTFTPVEVEVRNRTLWAVYCGDKISAAYGRPVLLRLETINAEEINVTDETYSERSSVDLPTMLPWTRAAIRQYMVLERIVEKINIASCTHSDIINSLTRGTRRIDETSVHDVKCSAKHNEMNFDEELRMLSIYQAHQVPSPGRDLLDDKMYHCHEERLRTTADFGKIMVLRHLIAIHNNNLSSDSPSLQHCEELLETCKDLLVSQRKMLDRGQYTDFASTCSYQISQTGRALIPMSYLLQLERQRPGSSNNLPATRLDSVGVALNTTLKLLRLLSLRLDSAKRSLEILRTCAHGLDVKVSVNRNRIIADLPAPLSSEDELGNPRAGAAKWIRDLPLKNPLTSALGVNTECDPFDLFAPGNVLFEPWLHFETENRRN